MHQGARRNDEAKKHAADWVPHRGKKKSGKKSPPVKTGHKNRYAQHSRAAAKQESLAKNGGTHITAKDRELMAPPPRRRYAW